MTDKAAADSPLLNDRDSRMKRGLMAYLAEGTLRKASAVTGVPINTISYWARTQAGKDMIAKLRADFGPELAKELLATARMAHEQLRAAIEKGLIPPTQLAITLGILVDKARCLQPPAQDQGDGDWHVEIKFGGSRAAVNGAVSGAMAALTGGPGGECGGTVIDAEVVTPEDD